MADDRVTTTRRRQACTAALTLALGSTLLTPVAGADETGPKVSVDDVSVTEGDAGTTDATFTISIDELPGLFGTVTVAYGTTDGTATADDYDEVSGTVTLGGVGQVTSAEVDVPVRGDTVFELDEEFLFLIEVTEGDATTARPQGTGAIVDDDEPVDDILFVAGPTAAIAGRPALLADDDLLLSDGFGEFTTKGLDLVDGAGHHVGDFTGDGFADILSYTPGEGGDEVLVSNTDGTFRRVAFSATGTYQPILGNFAGDDDLVDVFWYAPGARTDYFFESEGDGTFTASSRQVNGAYEITPFDADGDGDDDLLFYRPGSSDDYLFLNDGDLGFTPVTLQLTPDYQVFPGNFVTASSGEELFLYADGATPDFIVSFTGTGSANTKFLDIRGRYQIAIGDYDDDGTDDAVFFQPGQAADYTGLSTGTGRFEFTRFSASGDYTLLAGEFVLEGGGDDLLWYAESGADYVFTSNGDGTFDFFTLDQPDGFEPFIADFG